MDGANRLILTAEPDNGLVAREALAALAKQGWQTVAWPMQNLTPQTIAKLFALPPERSGLTARPSLFFSINFRGLDKFGEFFSALDAKDVPVAVWCVDNPWNLLSGLRSDFWKKTRLFITDPSFIPALKKHGARHVHFLPLATDPAVFAAHKSTETTRTTSSMPILFVGRSAFPDKERFFVGQALPLGSIKKALTQSQSGTRTDFFWWLAELGFSPETTLWPGGAARKASFGADESSLAWRSACLHEATPAGLAIYGDAAWAERLPQNRSTRPELHGPVDYYNGLSTLYAQASFSLNMMSFLLPRGLNQRHFDVWAAGGFCLMDNCPGLDLFPQELVAPAAFKRPQDIPEIINRFKKDAFEKNNVTEAWRKLIFEEHTYAKRMQKLTATIFS